MGMPIGKLGGMSYQLEIKLKERGICNSNQLLQAARTPAGRGVQAGQIDAGWFPVYAINSAWLMTAYMLAT
jgi:hypothetical protein